MLQLRSFVGAASNERNAAAVVRDNVGVHIMTDIAAIRSVSIDTVIAAMI